MAEDDEFLRKFAVQIAAALRDKEDAAEGKKRQNQPSIDESVEDLYRSLVFDEPLVDRIPNLPVVASALSRQLSTTTSPYAISNRLVNGIMYLCNQHATTLAQQKKKESTGNEKNVDAQNLNRDDKPSHSTIQVAMAKLAFCILVDLPLQCCRENSSSSSHLSKIRRLLGSYKGTKRTNPVRNLYQEEQEAAATISKETNSKVQDEEKVDAANDETHPVANAQQSETEEVWAAESDPSDFDYGEGDDAIHTDSWLQQESDVDWLDPKVLSKPDPNTSLQDIRDAIGSLLQLASYTLLEPIFCLPQKETSQYISKLTHLVLVLLQPRKPINNSASSGGDDSLLVGASMDDAILSPLWILRDAAIYHGNNEMKRSAASNYEQSYLQVLQTLLAMDQAHLQDVGKLTPEPDLCVSSIVGLSSMSSWCTTQRKPTQVTIDAIVDSMNDLEHIIERGHQIYKSNLPSTLIPILETLSGIHYDRLNNNNVATAPCYKGSAIPQTLLNSGLLRQILSLVATTNDESNNDKSISSTALGFHHALWGLCIAYPKIVGKYVFRHSGSSQIIRSYAIQLDTSAPQNCVQCILWNVYGWHQCQEASGSGLSSLRKPGSSSAPRKLTQDECSEVCQKAWSRLCNLVREALVDSETNNDASSERVIEEWGRLLVLASGTHITQDFKTLVDSSLLNDVSSVVSKQVTHNNKRIDSPSDDGKEDDDKDDKPSRKQKTVSQAHKLLKKYKLFFQGTTSGSSKTD